MLARTPLRDQMIAWLERQDPEQHYFYDNPWECACGQFAHQIRQFEEWIEMFDDRSSPWSELDTIAGRGKPSFGALLHRLKRAKAVP